MVRLRVFVDESGRPDYVSPSCKRRQALFVLAGIVVDDNGYSRLLEEYERILDMRLEGPSGTFTLRELFSLYERVTGLKAEVKAGWLVSGEGPFSFLRQAPREVKQRIVLGIFESMLRSVTAYAKRVYVIVLDKVRVYQAAKRIREISGLEVNVRALALDFLVTRLARLYPMEEAGDIELVHDEISECSLVTDYLEEGKRRGYIYNPKARVNPSFYRRIHIVFKRSEEEPLLQYADVVAYTARSLKSGTADPLEEKVYRRNLCVAVPGKVKWIEYTRGKRVHIADD